MSLDKENYAAIVAMIGLLIFMFLFSMAIWESWRTLPSDEPLSPADVDDPRNYVATSLAGLVGGFFATYFGVPEAKPLIMSELFLRSWVVSTYLVVYMVYGSVAIITWMQRGKVTYIAVRNLAVTFLGMIPFIAMSFLRAPNS